MTAAAAQPDPIQPAAPADASQLAPATVTPTQAADGRPTQAENPRASSPAPEQLRSGGAVSADAGAHAPASAARETRNQKRETILDSAELKPFLIEQDSRAYTQEAHAVWRLLFARRMDDLRQVGSRAFLRGIEAIGLTPDRVPSLDEMNARLEPITGWRAVAVSGFLEPRLFFQCLAERRFPTTVIVRPMEQLEYLPEPDIFHDVFGHVPMHADPVFADFLQRFGAIASTARNQAETRMLTRLFWFTVEFGLIREDAAVDLSSRGRRGDRGTCFSAPRETSNEKRETDADGIRVYGSGLISSVADCKNALGAYCERRPFVLDEVLAQEFEIDHLQPVLFVIDSHQQLFDAVEQVRERMSRGLLAEDGERVAVNLCGHNHGREAVAVATIQPSGVEQDLP